VRNGVNMSRVQGDGSDLLAPTRDVCRGAIESMLSQPAYPAQSAGKKPTGSYQWFLSAKPTIP
jgi:hypothetical protein